MGSLALSSAQEVLILSNGIRVDAFKSRTSVNEGPAAVPFFAVLFGRVAKRPCQSLLHVTEHEIKRATDEYIDERRASRKPRRVGEIAGRLGLSVPKFSNYFFDVTGLRPSTYFKRSDALVAIDLLRNTDLDYVTIAQITGIGSRTTLFRLIRRISGRTPGSFRQRMSSLKKKQSRKARGKQR